MFTSSASTNHKDVCHLGLWNEDLCPESTIIHIEDVQIGPPSCKVACDNVQSLSSDLESLAQYDNDSFVDIRWKCDGRRRCDQLYLEPVLTTKIQCSQGGSYTRFKRFLYRCLQGNYYSVLLNWQ